MTATEPTQLDLDEILSRQIVAYKGGDKFFFSLAPTKAAVQQWAVSKLPVGKDYQFLSVQTRKGVKATVKGKSVEAYNTDNYNYSQGYNQAITDMKEALNE